MSKYPTWISEAEASKKIGYRPRVLRMYVKKGKLDIGYTTNLGGKSFQYSAGDIDKFLLKNSTFIK